MLRRSAWPPRSQNVSRARPSSARPTVAKGSVSSSVVGLGHARARTVEPDGGRDLVERHAAVLGVVQRLELFEQRLYFFIGKGVTTRCVREGSPTHRFSGVVEPQYQYKVLVFPEQVLPQATEQAEHDSGGLGESVWGVFYFNAAVNVSIITPRPPLRPQSTSS